MVKNYKLFILGGRSGTTLMQKLIMLSYEFDNWHRGKDAQAIRKAKDKRTIMRTPTQVPYRNAWTIYENYPNVPKSILNPMKNHNLAKLPEFDLIIDMIIERFKTPKFIILERDLDSIVSSYEKTFGRDIAKMIFKHEGCREECKKLLGTYPKKNTPNDKKIWWKWLIKTREEKIKEYEQEHPENVLRINFDVFMKNFRKTMRRVSKFLGIKPTIKLWCLMREIKSVPTKTDVRKYL